MVSKIIAMAPGERLDIKAVFEHPPTRELFPISLVTKKANDRFAQRRSVTHGMFFGAMMIFVLFFLLSPNSLYNAASNWFCLYLLSTATLGMHSHGYSLIFFDVPAHWYFPLLRLLQTGLMLFYLLFGLSFLRAGQAFPTYWRAVWGFIVIGLSIAVLEQVLGRTEFQVVANLVPLGFTVLGAWGAFLAFRHRVHGSRFFAAGFAVLMFGGWLNFMASLPRYATLNELIDQLTLLNQIVDAMIFGGAILYQIYGLKGERDQAIKTQLAEAKRRLELNAKLANTQASLRQAQNLAEHHRVHLASASHDLRQPIASLRMSLEAAKVQTPELVSDLATGIEFLDKVLEQTLDSTRVDPNAPVLRKGEDDVFALQVILENNRRMFASEAAEKGVTLRLVDSSLSVRLPVIDLIRIVSNLTSNALRYTPSGDVLIGVRRRGSKAIIEIWDTGVGIPADQLTALLQPYVRGANDGASSGEGLGLSIVKQLADRNELSLKVCSTPGKGSVFALEGLIIES